MTKILEEIGAESGAGGMLYKACLAWIIVKREEERERERKGRRKSFPHSYKASIALDACDIRYVYDRYHLEYCANIGATRRELFTIYSLGVAG